VKSSDATARISSAAQNGRRHAAVVNREAGITLSGYIGHVDAGSLPMSDAEADQFRLYRQVNAHPLNMPQLFT
jgi:hypothetical protein